MVQVIELIGDSAGSIISGGSEQSLHCILQRVPCGVLQEGMMPFVLLLSPEAVSPIKHLGSNIGKLEETTQATPQVARRSDLLLSYRSDAL